MLEDNDEDTMDEELTQNIKYGMINLLLKKTINKE